MLALDQTVPIQDYTLQVAVRIQFLGQSVAVVAVMVVRVQQVVLAVVVVMVLLILEVRALQDKAMLVVILHLLT
jgi:hypothetical protein